MVKTDRGYLLVFLVAPSGSGSAALLRPIISNRNSSDNLVSPADDYDSDFLDNFRGVPNYTLHLSVCVQIRDGIECAVALNSHILIATKTRRFCLLGWNGDRILENTDEMDFIMDAIGDPTAAHVEKMIFDSKMDLLSMIMSDGSVYLSFRKDQRLDPKLSESEESPSTSLGKSTTQLRKFIHFFCIEDSNGQKINHRPVHISSNANQRLVVIGTESGPSLVYNINSENQLFFSHKILIPAVGEIQSASVTCSAWSSDGHALAIGYSNGGFSIVTAFGRLLFSTLNQDSVTESEKQDQLYLNGVNALFWGLGNFELFLAPRETEAIYSVPCAKYAIISCNIRENMRNPFLIGDDRLLIHSGASNESSPLSMNSTVWQVLQIPQDYLRYNWPIRYAASSHDGKRIVVAGKRGFALCNLTSNRWKLFGNQQYEKSFFCSGGLIWFRNMVLVACQDMSTLESQIRIFPSEQNLDNVNLLHFEKFEKRIILMNCLFNQLLVYTADNVIRHMAIDLDGNSKISLRHVRNIKLECGSPSTVQYLDWYVPVVDQLRIEECVTMSPILLHQEGKLSIIDWTQSPQKRIHLGDKIEFCWPYFPRRPIGDICNILWAFDGTHAKVWANLLLIENPALQMVCRNLSDPCVIKLDFYPMSVLFQKGIIVGVDQTLSSRYVDGLCFKSIAKTYLFLHDIVHNFLSSGYYMEALRYSWFYKDFDYFSHSMEILLHKVLEAEWETKIGFHEDALLPVVIEFLSNYPQFYDIIVQCARKTEVSMWSYLFSIVGDPKDMFQYCMEQNNLRTATSFLIILQTLEPYSVSSKLQMDLVEKVLETEDFGLCAEIVRYLNNVARTGDDEVYDGESVKSSRSTRLLAVTAEEEQTFFIDILISRYARKLMLNRRLRTLGKLSAAVGFPLPDWLRKERNRCAMLTGDLGSIFKELHNQFDWPYPDSKSAIKSINDTKSTEKSVLTSLQDLSLKEEMNMVTRRLFPDSSAQNSPSGSLSEMDRGSLMNLNESRAKRDRSISMPSANGRRPSHRGSIEDEIRSLLNATKKAKCYGWAVLLATLVLDLGGVVELFHDYLKDREHSTALIDQYRQLLLSTGNPVYTQFLRSIEEVLSLTQ